MKRWGVALAVVILLGGVLSVPNRASAAQSVAITPTSTEQVVQPGGQVKGTVQVLNQADTPFDVKLYTAPYSVTGEDYDPSFTPIPGATQASDWIKLSTSSTSLRSYSGSSIDYTVTVPANTAPGGYYGVIFAETQSKVEGSGVTTLKRVGSVIYIRVAGQVTESGRVVSWQVAWLQQPNLSQAVRIENSGGTFFTATIKTEVRDIFGRPKFSYSQKRKILPGKIRRIQIVWDKTPPIGLFVVAGQVDMLGKSNQLASKYVLVLSQDARNAILAIVIIIILFSLVKRILRRRKKKRDGTQIDKSSHA